ncbi:MAG: hypothetical protein M3N33_00480 [Actinomycetota bacterium]|nr:hypothetical protein [Actinomycetota bacterium]
MKKPRTAKKKKRRGPSGRAGTPPRSAPSTLDAGGAAPSVEGDGEPVYLRFGALPRGGPSYDGLLHRDERGVSCFRGRKGPGRQGYAVVIPLDQGQLELQMQTRSLMNVILEGRAVYEAGGTEVGLGGDGEPLLASPLLKPIPPFVRVDLPDWWGEEGRRFAGLWNGARKSMGARASREARLRAAAFLGSRQRPVLEAATAAIAREVSERGSDWEDLKRVLGHADRLRARREELGKEGPVPGMAATIRELEDGRFRVGFRDVEDPYANLFGRAGRKDKAKWAREEGARWT